MRGLAVQPLTSAANRPLTPPAAGRGAAPALERRGRGRGQAARRRAGRAPPPRPTRLTALSSRGPLRRRSRRHLFQSGRRTGCPLRAGGGRGGGGIGRRRRTQGRHRSWPPAHQSLRRCMRSGLQRRQPPPRTKHCGCGRADALPPAGHGVHPPALRATQLDRHQRCTENEPAARLVRRQGLSRLAYCCECTSTSFQRFWPVGRQCVPLPELVCAQAARLPRPARPNARPTTVATRSGAMPSAAEVRALYRAFLRESAKFPNYNVRE